MDDDAQPPIVHDSVFPSRGGMPGETAFLTAWQDLMAGVVADDEEDDPLSGAHSAEWSRNPDYDQDDAAMAATLIQWLGTNAGACMINLARTIARGGLSGPDAFRAAWAVTNARKRASNSDLRSIETMMIPPDAPRRLDGTPLRAPRVTPRMYETAEHVCAWLGTREGQDFIAAREREMEAFHAHERIRQRESNRTGTRTPHGMGAQAIAEYLAVMRKAAAGARERQGAA